VTQMLQPSRYFLTFLLRQPAALCAKRVDAPSSCGYG
jgi:hypothetical protein